MAICAYYKTQETQLYVNDLPVCLTCAEAPPSTHKPPATEREIGDALLQRMLTAVSLNDEAANEFDHAVSQARTGRYNPDGTQRIKDAASKMSAARDEMMVAHTRLNDFIERGIVPEDLKRSG